jgi:hypothetical protein
MSEMVPLGSLIARRESRELGRQLSRLEGKGRLELATINQQADLQAERVGAVAYVGKRALHETAMLSQLEVQLAMLVPAATSRLQGLADLTALGMAEVVAETVRRVR